MAHKLSSQDASRLVDFVNDKIQTTADLQNLDTLLKNLEEKQNLQKKQLREAEKILENATKASIQHAETVRRESEAFHEKQADLDARLMAVTQSESSDEATAKLEANVEKLRRMDMAKGYFEVLNGFDKLSKDVLTTMKTSPFETLQPYTQLRSMVTAISSGQEIVEGATPRLLEYAEGISQKLRDLMCKEYSDSLQKILEKLKWPTKDHPSGDLMKEWEYWCELLLEFQEPELITEADDISSKNSGQEIPILLPLEVMVRPMELRFKYHFSGDRPTNRLDKPEYFLSHVIDLINTHSEFFVAYLQPIFDRRLRDANPHLSYLYSDAVSAYITALLPMLRQKITSILPQISKHPQTLSHLMHELMNFDTELRDAWAYSPNPGPESPWKGLTWEILVKEDWFSQWLLVEKNFALSRYQNIIDAEDGGEIDYDGVAPTATKPTKAAIRVNDLLETVTDLYKPLSSFSQKIRFLIDIQITIFDLFHERLHSGLEAYLAMTSTIGRTVKSSTTRGNKPSLESVSGLERLCRIFGSAEYLEKKMQDWSDDVFFLELWYELQNHVDQNSRTGRPVAGPMSVTEIAARTSSSVVSNSGRQGERVEGALFDETSAAYRRLRMRSESIIISTLVSTIQSSLRPYSQVSTWTSLSSPSDGSGQVSPSLDLAPALRTLSNELSFISRVLAVAPRHRIAHKLLLSIQTYIWDNILMRNTFSTIGAAQIWIDIENICSTVDVAIGGQEIDAKSIRVVQKLTDGLFLLGLKIQPEKGRDHTEVALQEDGLNNDDMITELGLWEVEKKLFASNEDARNVLMKLGVETLTEAEARSVLERRVEVRS